MPTIDLSNFNTAAGLVQSTGNRAGNLTDGNIFYDLASGLYEIIDSSEQAFIDLTSRGAGTAGVAATATVASTWYKIATLGTTDFTLIGATVNTVGHVFQASGAGTGTGTVNEATANPLAPVDGVKFEALYAFEREQRRVDENLRKFDPYFKGNFKFAGAYEVINSRKFAGSDRAKIRGSGWRELASDGGIDRIYYGNVSLGNIDAGSQPYYQLAAFGATTDYAKTGPVDEAIQVFGSTANTPSDAGAGNFDTRTYEALSVRTYGNNHDRKFLADSGVSEMGGYSTGFALEETTHLTTNTTDHPFADVWTTPAGVWVGMTLEELDTPQTETGFNETDGNFTWVLNNPSGANLTECVAYLDAIATVDGDINAHTTNSTNGKQSNVWYRYTSAGKIQPLVGTAAAADIGTAGEGLFIEGLTGVDKLNIVHIDDAGNTKTYPFNVSNVVLVGTDAVADVLAWFHCFFRDGADNTPGGGDDFGDAGAVTVQASDATEVKGDLSSLTTVTSNALHRTADSVVFEFDYDGDTVGGPAGADKWVVFECEGDGGVTYAKTSWQITNASASINATCVPPVETNV